MPRSTKTTGNGIYKGVILKDGSQPQQYDPHQVRQRRDTNRVHLAEQDVSTTKGQAKAGESSARILDQGKEVNRQENWNENYSEVSGLLGIENLFVDPEFRDWSNGTSVSPAMYQLSGTTFTVSRATDGVAGPYCTEINSLTLTTFKQIVFFASSGLSSFDLSSAIGDFADGGVFLNRVVFSFYINNQSTYGYGGVVRPFIIQKGGATEPTHYGEPIDLATMEPSIWHRFYVVTDLDPSLIAGGTAYLEVGLRHTPGAGGIYRTDAWQLERGLSPTAWRRCTRKIKDIVFNPTNTISGTSWVALTHPGGGDDGIVPAIGEEWVLLNLQAISLTPNFTLAGQTIRVRARRVPIGVAGNTLLTAVITEPNKTGGVGSLAQANYIGETQSLLFEITRSWANPTASEDFQVSARVLVLGR